MLKQFLAYFQGTSKMGCGTTGHNALCAHSLTFAAYTRASALGSISSPPCSNLCIPCTRPSLLSSDRRRACKKNSMQTNCLQASAATVTNVSQFLLKIDGKFYEMRLTHTSARRAGMDPVCSASGMCGGMMAESDR